VTRIPTGVRPSVAELDVLILVANGQTNASAAHHLGIDVQIVNSRLKSLYAKLGAEDRAHAVAIALRRRLIRLDQITVPTPVRNAA
jgi:DNA-binding CsgD family transcriptional regulator